MRSRASFRGHPIHPALIPFPFAFLWGAFLFDAAGWLLDRPALWTTGGHLAAAGVVAALLAAVPGIVDYRYTVPPDSSGKKRATKHMLAMSSATVIFAVAWVLRGGTDHAPALSLLIAEAAGAALLGAGGWMGGVLVARNQVGVDPRYAGSAKWSERTVDGAPGDSVTVAKENELRTDQMRLIRAGAHRIVLARSEAGYVAFDDHCTHRGGSLAGGTMICGTVQCPWHGSQFDVATGAVKSGPAEKPIRTHEVRVVNGEVRLTLP
jgi:nitrite reductase/ring-hydroxylating ferredoxin subunit/uncharacterized membrane protein